jgi:hypothetical protein
MIIKIKKLKNKIILMYFQVKNIFKNYFILQSEAEQEKKIKRPN